MRLLVILFFLLPLSQTGCDSKDSKSDLLAEVAALKKENESLRNKTRKLDASILSYERTLKEIDFNLSRIELSMTMVGEIRREGKSDKTTTDKIMSRMEVIQRLINNSDIKTRILDNHLNELRKTSSSQSTKILELDRALKQSAKTLLEKQNDFDRQKELIAVDLLEVERMYVEQKAKTDELKRILNRAWFYAGTAKELKRDKIVDTRGGFIGIGKVKILNATSPESFFMQIEKENTYQKVIQSQDIKLVTQHPQSSYKIAKETGYTVLNILDKNAFWKGGNYLIVQKE